MPEIKLLELLRYIASTLHGSPRKLNTMNTVHYHLLKGSTPETAQPRPGTVNSASTRMVQSLVTLAESQASAISEVVT